MKFEASYMIHAFYGFLQMKHAIIQKGENTSKSHGNFILNLASNMNHKYRSEF
jgi:hypothetical protein